MKPISKKGAIIKAKQEPTTIVADIPPETLRDAKLILQLHQLLCAFANTMPEQMGLLTDAIKRNTDPDFDWRKHERDIAQVLLNNPSPLRRTNFDYESLLNAIQVAFSGIASGSLSEKQGLGLVGKALPHDKCGKPSFLTDEQLVSLLRRAQLLATPLESILHVHAAAKGRRSISDVAFEAWKTNPSCVELKEIAESPYLEQFFEDGLLPKDLQKKAWRLAFVILVMPEGYQFEVAVTKLFSKAQRLSQPRLQAASRLALAARNN